MSGASDLFQDFRVVLRGALPNEAPRWPRWLDDAGRPSYWDKKKILFSEQVDRSLQRQSSLSSSGSRLGACGWFVRFAFVVSTVLGVCWARPAFAANGPPNIILIVVDDQGWNGTSVRMDPDLAESQSDYHQTPTLESLASAGMRFSSAYVSPMCAPTQMALQTGMSWARLQRSDNSNSPGYGYSLMPPMLSSYPNVDSKIRQEVSIAQRIKEVHPDYRTGHFGKYAQVLNNWAYFDDSVLQGDLPPEVDPKDMFTFTNRANEFIQESVDAGKPFFATFTHNAVKYPVEALPETIDKYENLPKGTRHHQASYAAMTEDFDTSVGMVLQKLQDLGIEDNTYVIYTSDNGRGGVNQPLRGGKGRLWEGGIRVPLVIKGPGIAPGSVSEEPVIVMDLFPTITELTGNTYPLREEIDGASLVPILQNGGQLPEGMSNLRRPYGENGELFFHYTRPNNPQSAVIDGDYKLLKYHARLGYAGAFELYNLADDLSESTNLANAMPEKVAELDQKLSRWLQGVDASQSYDVAAPMRLEWNADYPGKQDDVELSILKASLGTDRPRSDLNGDGIVDQQDLDMKLSEFPKTWRSTIDVDYKFRETWTLGEDGEKPQHVATQPHQPDLPRKAFRFDGDDRMERMYFHVTNPNRSDSYDNSASFEFWVRLDSMDQPQMLFETGDENQGLSLSFGDGDNDGDFDELRFRAKDDNGDFISVTSEFDLYADPTRDFVQIVAVLNDSATGRYAQLYVNGALFAQVSGIYGSGNYINWDGFDKAGLGGVAGTGAGGNDGFGDLPFLGGFQGEVALARFYNYAIDGSLIQNRYNEVLMPVAFGLDTFAGDIEVPLLRPTNVSRGTAESSSLMVIQERNDVLDAALAVDALITGPATFDAVNTGDAGSLAAGTEFTSYLLQFDPVGNNGLSMESITGTIDFEREILAILFDDALLVDTDSLLGVIGNYGSQTNRGLELAGHDFLTISADRKTLSFSLVIPGDEMLQFRVVTEQAILGDFNNDGLVDGVDFALWESSFALDGGADADGDGDSDGFDFLAWQRQFAGGGSAAASLAVPEPSTLFLALVASFGLPGVLRSKRFC